MANQQPDEKAVISLFLKHFDRCEGHHNLFFESDAEILDPLQGKMLFTTDEFSSEDFFLEGDPHLLGWNLACCTISDILASGGTPAYFGHALTLSTGWDEDFINRFASGIALAVKSAGAGFIGGDLGVSGSWKYTGICLGYAASPLTRKGAAPGDSLYLTGQAGAGNLMAAMKLFPVEKETSNLMQGGRIQFPLRMKESEIIKAFAGCCIDTSDGVLNALNALADINQTGFRVSHIPYLEGGRQICSLLAKPQSFLFAGECGEYELLFTVSKKREKEFLNEVARNQLQFTYIGEVSETPDRILMEDGKKLDFGDFNISARGFKSIADYLFELTKYIAHAQGPG